MSDTKWLTVRETMEQMIDWLKKKEPFFHTRYNDGEWLSMFHMKSPSDSTSEEHHFTADVGNALFTTFEELSGEITKKDHGHILIGSNWYLRDELPPAKRFHTHISGKQGFVDKVLWCLGDVWYTTADERAQTVDSKGTIELIDELRTGDHRVVFVSNQIVKEAKFSLGAEKNILIPQIDAYREYQQILWKCEDLAEDEPTIFVWCGGFPVKSWSYEIWKKFPDCSHIDLGSLFDGVFEHYNRGWLERKESEPPHWSHWRYLQNTFKPYVRSFIQCRK